MPKLGDEPRAAITSTPPSSAGHTRLLRAQSVRAVITMVAPTIMRARAMMASPDGEAMWVRAASHASPNTRARPPMRVDPSRRWRSGGCCFLTLGGRGAGGAGTVAVPVPPGVLGCQSGGVPHFDSHGRRLWPGDQGGVGGPTYGP